MPPKTTSSLPERLQRIASCFLDMLEDRINNRKTPNSSGLENVFGQKRSYAEIFVEISELIIKLEQLKLAATKRIKSNDADTEEPEITTYDIRLIEDFISRQRILEQSLEMPETT